MARGVRERCRSVEWRRLREAVAEVGAGDLSPGSGTGGQGRVGDSVPRCRLPRSEGRALPMGAGEVCLDWADWKLSPPMGPS